jgi:hypothetical protein
MNFFSKYIIALALTLAPIIALSKPYNREQGANPDPYLYLFFDELYNFRFAQADSIIQQVSPLRYSEYSIAHAYSLWWKGLTYPGFNEYFVSLEALSHGLVGIGDQVKLSPKDDPFMKMIIGAFGIRIASIKGENATALRIFLKIKPTLINILETPQLSEEYKLIAGVYHYAAAGIRKNFFMLRPFFVFLPTADENAGKELLMECTSSMSVPTATEAHYFLFKIEKEIYGQNEKAYKHIQWLVKTYPNNLLFNLDFFNLRSVMGENTTVLRKELIAKIEASTLDDQQKQHFLNQIK